MGDSKDTADGKWGFTGFRSVYNQPEAQKLRWVWRDELWRVKGKNSAHSTGPVLPIPVGPRSLRTTHLTGF